LGPALGTTRALADPILTLHTSAGAQLATNDDWGGDSALAVIAGNVGAQPLASTSKDAVVNFVPPAAGAYTAEVTGAANTSGIALLEIFEADAQRATQLSPAIVVPPDSVAISAGQSAAFATVAVGRPAPTFQWRRNGAPITGATNASLSLPAAQTSDAGSYDVVVMNSSGTVTSPAVALTVNPQAAHSADTDRNFRLGILELTRVIELYNARTGTVRTGRYSVQQGTEDGFAPDLVTDSNATVSLPYYHSADTNHDGRINLLELTRVIELYNHRSGTTRTGEYHIQAGTEDGYAPGP
jgi:hypothetical protein